MKRQLLIISMLLAVTAMAQVPSYVPTNRLAGYWGFSGNANDISGNGHNGTINGAALALDRWGNASSAYSFDGINNSIKVNDHDSLDLTEDFTISLWFNANNATEFNSFLSKANCGDASVKGYVTGLQDFPNAGLTPKVHLQAFPYMGNADPCLPLNNGIPLLNRWYNFTTTYNKTTETLEYYLNGFLKTSLNLAFEIDNTPLDIYIGTHIPQTAGSCASNNGFSGTLDDIGIWNRVLTPDEIKGLYTGGMCFQYITVTDTLLINANITGFNPIVYNNEIKVYPNPSKDQLTLDFGSNYLTLNGYTLKILNASGATVYTTLITSQQSTVAMNTWSAGIYFVHLLDYVGNTRDIKKIILQ